MNIKKLSDKLAPLTPEKEKEEEKKFQEWKSHVNSFFSCLRKAMPLMKSIEEGLKEVDRLNEEIDRLNKGMSSALSILLKAQLSEGPPKRRPNEKGEN